MEQFRKLYGNRALIIGAAAGIGKAFSEVLAAQGMELVMVDHDAGSLEQTASGISQKRGIHPLTLVVDMNDPTSWQQCLDGIREHPCRLLVYVAAYSRVKPFLESSHEELDRYLQVNNRSLLHLVHGFIQSLREQEQTGGVLLMTSLSAIIPAPLVAPYSGTKGFILKLAESLYQEFHPLNIAITACAAGITATPTWFANHPRSTWLSPEPMDPGKVARFALTRLGKGPLCIPGWQNRFSYWVLTHLLPNKMAAGIVSGQMKHMFADE